MSDDKKIKMTMTFTSQYFEKDPVLTKVIQDFFEFANIEGLKGRRLSNLQFQLPNKQDDPLNISTYVTYDEEQI